MTLLFPLLLALAAAQVDGSEADHPVARHLEAVSQAMGHEVAFEETRTSPLLTEPLISTGQLVYRAEDRALIKTIRSPDEATLTLTDRQVELTSGGKSRRFSLKSRPELLALQGGFRSLVEGDFDNLNRFFTSRLEWSTDDQWALLLTPRNRRLGRYIERITVVGAGSQVTGITSELRDGERQQMVLRPEP